MTYKLNPVISIIASPIVFVFPDGERKQYASGKEAESAVFDRRYGIVRIDVADNMIEAVLEELKGPVAEIGDDVTFF